MKIPRVTTGVLRTPASCAVGLPASTDPRELGTLALDTDPGFGSLGLTSFGGALGYSLYVACSVGRGLT